MMETEKIGEQIRTDSEYIKLIKNNKGYNWEIKVLSTEIARVVELNDKMKEEFGLDE